MAGQIRKNAPVRELSGAAFMCSLNDIEQIQLEDDKLTK